MTRAYRLPQAAAARSPCPAQSRQIGALLQARDEVSQINDNARRIARVRDELFSEDGVVNGAVLASRRELAGRLERAGRQLDGALYDAERRIGSARMPSASMPIATARLPRD